MSEYMELSLNQLEWFRSNLHLMFLDIRKYHNSTQDYKDEDWIRVVNNMHSFVNRSKNNTLMMEFSMCVLEYLELADKLKRYSEDRLGKYALIPKDWEPFSQEQMDWFDGTPTACGYSKGTIDVKTSEGLEEFSLDFKKYPGLYMKCEGGVINAMINEMERNIGTPDPERLKNKMDYFVELSDNHRLVDGFATAIKKYAEHFQERQLEQKEDKKINKGR